ncbi:MAG: hypothetical protein V1897_17245 [Pseudomonadota bacterium]
MLPNKIGAFDVIPSTAVSSNRQFAGSEPPIVYDKTTKTVSVNLVTADKEVFLLLAAHFLPGLAKELADMAASVTKHREESKLAHVKLLSKLSAEEAYKAKVEAVKAKMAKEAAALAEDTEEAEIRKQIEATAKKGKK